MTLTPRLAFITIAAPLAYLGLAVLGRAGFAAFFSHPALIVLAITLFVLSGVALFSGGNLSPGVREDRANRVGGVHTELRLPRRRRGQRNSTSQDIIAVVRQLVLIANDELIAGILNRNELTTGYGNRWTRERVTALRSHHKIPVYCPAGEGHEPWLNLSKAAAHLQISPKTLRLAAECREIDALHPLPEGPWVFRRAVLDSTAAKALVLRARNPPKPHHGTASRSTKPLLFSDIARWV
jgi:hypothetical protein